MMIENNSILDYDIESFKSDFSLVASSPQLKLADVYNDHDVSGLNPLLNPLYTSLPSAPTVTSSQGQKKKGKILQDCVGYKIKKATSAFPIQSPIEDEYSYKEYGLQRWREYVVLKYGENFTFQQSPHGKDLIIMQGLRKFALQLDGVNQWIRRVEASARTLEVELQVERDARKQAEAKESRLQEALRRYREDSTGGTGAGQEPFEVNIESLRFNGSSEKPCSPHLVDNNAQNSTGCSSIDGSDDPRAIINDLRFKLAVVNSEVDDLRTMESDYNALQYEHKKMKTEYEKLRREKREWKAARAEVMAKKEELNKTSLLRSELSALIKSRDEVLSELRKMKEIENQISELAVQLDASRRENNACRAELELRTRERDNLLQDRNAAFGGSFDVAVSSRSTAAYDSSAANDSSQLDGGSAFTSAVSVANKKRTSRTSIPSASYGSSSASARAADSPMRKATAVLKPTRIASPKTFRKRVDSLFNGTAASKPPPTIDTSLKATISGTSQLDQTESTEHPAYVSSVYKVSLTPTDGSPASQDMTNAAQEFKNEDLAEDLVSIERKMSDTGGEYLQSNLAPDPSSSSVSVAVSHQSFEERIQQLRNRGVSSASGARR